MKHSLRLQLIVALCFTFFVLPACNNNAALKLVDFEHAEMFQLPQQVIDFYYNAEENPKQIFTVLDSNYRADESFARISHLTETHYTIKINQQELQIRERDFRAPFLILNGRLYFSKSRILKGKLMTPQDLFIYFVDLKTVLK
jgi:hypothetical protein